MSTETARARLGDLVLDAMRDETVTVLTRYGRPAAAIVPLSYLETAMPTNTWSATVWVGDERHTIGYSIDASGVVRDGAFRVGSVRKTHLPTFGDGWCAIGPHMEGVADPEWNGAPMFRSAEAAARHLVTPPGATDEPPKPKPSDTLVVWYGENPGIDGDPVDERRLQTLSDSARFFLMSTHEYGRDPRVSAAIVPGGTDIPDVPGVDTIELH